MLEPKLLCTGKSLSEARICASTNPQYDDRLFIELQVQYMKIPSSEHGENMLCTEIVFDIQNNFFTKHVLSMFCKKKSFWKRFTCKLQLQKWSYTNVYGWPFQRNFLKNDHCCFYVFHNSQLTEVSQILQSEKQYSDSSLAKLPFWS